MNIVDKALAGIKVEQAQSARNLAVLPLSAPPGNPPDYIVFGKALAADQIAVTEISDGGSVSEIRVASTSERPVLILDGEELIGCKQNRIVNLSILVPPRKTLTIPVSCVEMGRWKYTSNRFAESEQTLLAGMRARKVAQVSASMAFSGDRRADQGEIWKDLARKSERLGTLSSSTAMSGIYEHSRGEVGSFLENIRWITGQVGALFAINGRCVGLELFDAPATCAHYLPKIAAGYVLEALDTSPDMESILQQEVIASLVQRTATAECAVFPALGLGDDLRLSGPNLVGGGLSVGGTLVHLCAFDLCNQTGHGNASESGRPTSTIPRSAHRFGR